LRIVSYCGVLTPSGPFSTIKRRATVIKSPSQRPVDFDPTLGVDSLKQTVNALISPSGLNGTSTVRVDEKKP